MWDFLGKAVPYVIIFGIGVSLGGMVVAINAINDAYKDNE